MGEVLERHEVLMIRCPLRCEEGPVYLNLDSLNSVSLCVNKLAVHIFNPPFLKCIDTSALLSLVLDKLLEQWERSYWSNTQITGTQDHTAEKSAFVIWLNMDNKYQKP